MPTHKQKTCSRREFLQRKKEVTNAKLAKALRDNLERRKKQMKARSNIILASGEK